MPEITLEPAKKTHPTRIVGDAEFTSGSPLNSTQASNLFGNVGGKTGTNHGIVSHYDTTVIPRGAQVNKAKLEAKTTISNSVILDADFDILALDTRLDSTSYQTVDAQFVYLPSSHPFFPTSDPLWDDGRITGGDVLMVHLFRDLRNDLGSVSQAWVANDDSPLIVHWWVVKRVEGNGIGDMEITTKIYEATGSAGSYRRGELIDVGTPVPVSSISTTIGSIYIVPGAGVGNWSPVDGTVYISELSFTGYDADSTASLGISWGKTFDGSTDNATMYASNGPDRTLQGFGAGEVPVKFEDGLVVQDLARSGTVDNIDMPSFAGAGYLFTFGHSDYSTSNFVELPNFTNNLQLALDDRTDLSQWIGCRIQNMDIETEDAKRAFRGANHVDPTRDSFHGVLLVVDYTLPAGGKAVQVVGSGLSVHTALAGSGVSIVELDGAGVSVATALAGSGTSVNSALTGTGTSTRELLSGTAKIEPGEVAAMQTDQDVTHIRGDDLQIPVTVSLDESRTLAGDEDWKWELKRDVDAPSLISKTSAVQITIDGTTKQPTILLDADDFPVLTFPPAATDQVFIHELQMTKDSKVETIMRGTFTLRSDVVS